ncbi:MAG: EAL domain-containing protein [Desulfuromonadaceae bacterium]|nr:EAL domain-containing protein [Desulfuromonadaceae bacterium]
MLRIFINAGHVYILEKMMNWLAVHDFSAQEAEGQIVLETAEFAALVRAVGDDPYFNPVELDSLNVLPLGIETKLHFGHVTEAKSLRAWHILLDAHELVRILEQGAIRTLFQPIICVEDMSVYAHEALARGVQSNGDMMAPELMFDIARATGMLFNLDRQCREGAIRTAARKQLQRNLFVNFLPTAIYSPEYCLRDTVRWAQQLNFDPVTIVFEVVEAEEVSDIEHLKRILRYCTERGFRVALDDVGSGYASLNKFVQLAPDIIKLDMELVRDIHKIEVKQAVAQALAHMARKADCMLLAEGVETADEFAWFKELGVDYVQGNYFGKPASEPLHRI